MLLFLAACADPELLTGVESRPMDAATFEGLAAAEVTDLALRTEVERGGSLRFSDGGPVAGTAEADEPRWRRLPVVEADAGVRVAMEDHGVRLLPWLDRSDLRITLAETTWVGLDGHRVPTGGAGVQLAAGTRIDSDADGEIARRSGELLRVQVPLSVGLLDEVYRPHPLARVGEADLWVASGTALADDAGASLGETTGVWEAHEVRRERGFILAEGLVESACGGTAAVVRAWVPESASISPHVWGPGWCCGCCGFGTSGWGRSGRTVDLHPDQLLYDAPDGSVIGVVTGATERPEEIEAGEMEGWQAFIEYTDWGRLTVWVADGGPTLDDVIPPDNAPAASHDVARRAEFDLVMGEAAASLERE